MIDAVLHRALLRPLDSELYEMYHRSFLYPRMSLAAALYDLGNEGRTDCHASQRLGETVLRKLHSLALEDGELSRDVYLRHTILHRRKVRLWQMICVLAIFVTKENHSEIVVHADRCLNMGNHSSVRQYVETFMVTVLLKFPDCINSLLEPALGNWSCKTQVRPYELQFVYKLRPKSFPRHLGNGILRHGGCKCNTELPEGGKEFLLSETVWTYCALDGVSPS